MHGTVAAQSASPAAAGQCTTSAALQRQHGQCSEICQQYSPQQQLQLFPFFVSVCWQTAIVTSRVPTNVALARCAWTLHGCGSWSGGQSSVGSWGICPHPLSVIRIIVSHVPPCAAAWSILLLGPAAVPKPAAGPGWVGQQSCVMQSGAQLTVACRRAKLRLPNRSNCWGPHTMHHPMHQNQINRKATSMMVHVQARWHLQGI